MNVAARIESSCKELGADILIAETTAAPHFALIEAGQVKLKGKSGSLTLFALVGDEAVAARPRS